MTTPADRAAFLGRVRIALGRTSPVPLSDSPGLEDVLIRLASSGPHTVNLFARRAAASGMMVHRTTSETCWATVLEILRASRATRVVMDSPDTAFTDGAGALVAAGLTIIDPRSPAAADAMFDAHAGITGVAAAVAETGSLVVASGRGRTRNAFIIPPIHIAIVREEQIVPDLIDLFARIGAPPTALTIISGPSKTADIEGILITGVHGPGHVHILLEAADP
jgi:L-lactate dehydrogenase complex protein LldG